MSAQQLADESSIDREYDEAEAEIRNHPRAGIFDKIFALIELRLERAHEKHFFGVEPCGLSHSKKKTKR